MRVGTVSEAKEILTTAGIPQGIVQAVCLPYGFRTVSDQLHLSKGRGALAIGASVVSVVVSVTVIALMVPTAWSSLFNSGAVEPTLVFFWMLLLVFVGCAIGALVLLHRAWIYYGMARGPG